MQIFTTSGEKIHLIVQIAVTCVSLADWRWRESLLNGIHSVSSSLQKRFSNCEPIPALHCINEFVASYFFSDQISVRRSPTLKLFVISVYQLMHNEIGYVLMRLDRIFEQAYPKVISQDQICAGY